MQYYYYLPFLVCLFFFFKARTPHREKNTFGGRRSFGWVVNISGSTRDEAADTALASQVARSTTPVHHFNVDGADAPMMRIAAGLAVKLAMKEKNHGFDRVPTPNSEYDSELLGAGYETETELDDAFDDANYSDESIPTFSSSKMIAECDDVVRVAAFPTPPVVEEEEATAVDWAAATPPPHLWPKDKEDLFANNPGGARTWDEVEAAMHRLVLYHAVRDTELSSLS